MVFKIGNQESEEMQLPHAVRRGGGKYSLGILDGIEKEREAHISMDDSRLEALVVFINNLIV